MKKLLTLCLILTMVGAFSLPVAAQQGEEGPPEGDWDESYDGVAITVDCNWVYTGSPGDVEWIEELSICGTNSAADFWEAFDDNIDYVQSNYGDNDMCSVLGTMLKHTTGSPIPAVGTVCDVADFVYDIFSDWWGAS